VQWVIFASVSPAVLKQYCPSRLSPWAIAEATVNTPKQPTTASFLANVRIAIPSPETTALGALRARANLIHPPRAHYARVF
jgi:hypothetical protein